MKPFVTSPAPHFKSSAYDPVTKSIVQLDLNDFKGKYVLLTFYPLDFTFVCPTEIVALSNLKEEFSKRNCEVICCSTDSVYSHKTWCEIPKSHGGFDNTLKITLLSDFQKTISRDYGVLNEEGLSLRGTFLIDTDQIVRHATINDLPVGRNMEEFLRVIDAFEFVKENGEVCPAQWKKKGDPTMKGDHNEGKTKEYFEKFFEVKKN